MVAFTVLTSMTYVFLNMILSEVFEDDAYILSCAIGFSGVLFAMKTLTTYIEPPSTTLLLGFIPVSSKWACWAELILIQVLVPHTSFTGHLAGILVGVAYTRGPLKRVIDVPFLSIFGYCPVIHGFESYDYDGHYSSSSSYTSRQNSTYSRQGSHYSRQPSRSYSRQESRPPPSTATSRDFDFDDISEEVNFNESAPGIDLEELRRRRAMRFTS